MTTLNFKRQDDNRKVYINPLARNTPEGEVMKVSVYLNDDGSIDSYEINYKEGHAFLGGKQETVKELPSNITLND